MNTVFSEFRKGFIANSSLLAIVVALYEPAARLRMPAGINRGGARMEEKEQRPDYADRDDPVDGNEEPEDEPTEVNPLDPETSAATEEELAKEKEEYGVHKEPEIQS